MRDALTPSRATAILHLGSAALAILAAAALDVIAAAVFAVPAMNAARASAGEQSNPGAAAFSLVSDEDLAAEQRFEALRANAPDRGTRALEAPASPASMPRITLISPQPGASAVVSPLRIELAFATSADARILPDSLRVRYGLLKIDITERLRPYAMVTDRGLVAENAAVPVGTHRLFLQISDTAGRTAVSQMQFTVVQ